MALTAPRLDVLIGDPSSGGHFGRQQTRQESPSTLEEDVSYDFSWLQHAAELYGGGQKAAALDVVYDRVDRLLSAAEYKQLDVLFSNIFVENLPPELLLALLTVTLPAAGKLVGRLAFYDQVWYSLEQAGESADEILHGLE